MQQVQQDVDVILIPEIVSFSLSRAGIPLDEGCPWPEGKQCWKLSLLYLIRAAAGSFHGHIILRHWKVRGLIEERAGMRLQQVPQPAPQAWPLLGWAVPSCPLWSLPDQGVIPGLCSLGTQWGTSSLCLLLGAHTFIPWLCPAGWKPAFPAFSGNPPPTSRLEQRQVAKPLPLLSVCSLKSMYKGTRQLQSPKTFINSKHNHQPNSEPRGSLFDQ